MSEDTNNGASFDDLKNTAEGVKAAFYDAIHKLGVEKEVIAKTFSGQFKMSLFLLAQKCTTLNGTLILVLDTRGTV